MATLNRLVKVFRPLMARGGGSVSSDAVAMRQVLGNDKFALLLLLGTCGVFTATAYMVSLGRTAA